MKNRMLWKQTHQLMKLLQGKRHPLLKKRLQSIQNKCNQKWTGFPILPQPVVEVPQEMTDPEKETFSPEKAVALETEQTNPETDHDPYIPETVEEEIPLEDTVSIETLPAAFPEPEDQASVTMDIFPEMGLHEEGVITPLE